MNRRGFLARLAGVIPAWLLLTRAKPIHDTVELWRDGQCIGLMPFQRALDLGRVGDAIKLHAGHTYVGNYVVNEHWVPQERR